MPNPYKRTPLWMTAVIIICMLPVLAYPFVLPSMPTDSLAKTLVWLYPVYVIVAGICTWIIYPQSPALAWILLVLMVFTHCAMYLL